MTKLLAPGGSYIIADDAHVAITTGKFTLQGIYMGDIVIPEDGAQVAQLIFFFQIFSPISKPIQNVSLQIKFPKTDQPFFLAIPDSQISESPRASSEKNIWNIRFPFPVSGPILHRGKIEIIVTHKSGKFELLPTWIITADENAQRMMRLSVANASPPPS